MLLEAARRTSGVAESPQPRVLQSELMDFYVQYTLLVPIAEARRRMLVLSELHGHIQDAFNEHGVQIMSPRYEADPDAPKVVRREDWFKEPAKREPGLHRGAEDGRGA
jgi:small-conductance mechanosensitive channel